MREGATSEMRKRRTRGDPRAIQAAERARNDEPPRRWRSIWISDLHLGTRECRSDLLLSFLGHYESEYLCLVGDVVDGWSIRRSWYWNDEHNRILQAILAKSSRGTRVTYVTGNHDDFLRGFAGLMLGGIAVKNEARHATADGRELLVLHGDGLDAVVRNARWLTHLGDHAYRLCKRVNRGLNAVRRLLGLADWSLAGHLRRRVKDALSYTERFEHAVASEARRRGFDGVVCGHIHQPCIRAIDGVLYCNDGDWVDSCTALVEDHEGKLAILRLSRAVPRPALVGSA